MILTKKQAIKVAKADYDLGIIFAVDLLANFGFDCSYYYEAIAKHDCDIDDDDFNIKTRNNLFKRLGIEKLMTLAYDKI